MTVPIMKLDVLLVPGTDRSVGHARKWLRGVLGEHPLRDDAALCVGELVTNAVRYTASGRGGQVRMELRHCDQAVRAEVLDEGGAPTVPRMAVPNELGVSGRGLLIVEFFAAKWGVERRGKGHAVWFEMIRDG